jgi:putative transposase
VNANQAMYGVVTMCRVLAVSASGYYAWLKRPLSARARADTELMSRLTAIHQFSRGTYGAPRIHEELSAAGIHVGRKRVARLMRAAGLRGVSRRRWISTTVRDRKARPASDLVERNFTAAAPDCLWVADITYIRTWAGFLYLAVVLDVFSRKIVGWAMATHLRTELVLEALNMALGQRHPAAVIHHSDQGSQYTSLAFGKRCDEAGVRPSMGSVGDCFDNAMCESFFATLECELLDRRHFKTQIEARMAVFEFIEGWYNPHRRHSALDYLSPINYERSRSIHSAQA